MRELNLMSPRKLKWLERPEPTLLNDDDAIVRPFVVGRCDADWLPIGQHVTRAMQAGLLTGLLDPGIESACGPKPFAGPFPIGHECVAEVVDVGSAVTAVAVGDKVVVPGSISCGHCSLCRRGLTGKCSTVARASGREQTVTLYGFGRGTEQYGGMASDFFRVPHANHMLVRVPDGLDPLRAFSAGDNLGGGWQYTVPHLRERPNATVLVVGGEAPSTGLYAAGVAAAHGAKVDYLDSSDRRLEIAESLGARAHERPHRIRFPKPVDSYDIVVEASSTPAGVRYAIHSTAPGGVCTAAGFYLTAKTGIPLNHMYLNDITLRSSLIQARPHMSELLGWVRDNDFPAEKVITKIEDFDDAPEVYGKPATKLVLCRPPLN